MTSANILYSYHLFNLLNIVGRVKSLDQIEIKLKSDLCMNYYTKSVLTLYFYICSVLIHLI